MDESWTIAELAELAAEAPDTPRALGADTSAATSGPDGGLDDGPGAGPLRTNGRVRDVPNERLIRWYGTVGLVDPPLSRRGRVARYGRRHLLQLVAVKRRQAEGKSLAEIQVELAGVDRRDPGGGRPGPGPEARAGTGGRPLAGHRRWRSSRRVPSCRPEPVLGPPAAAVSRRGAINWHGRGRHGRSPGLRSCTESGSRPA